MSLHATIRSAGAAPVENRSRAVNRPGAASKHTAPGAIALIAVATTSVQLFGWPVPSTSQTSTPPAAPASLGANAAISSFAPSPSRSAAWSAWITEPVGIGANPVAFVAVIEVAPIMFGSNTDAVGAVLWSSANTTSCVLEIDHGKYTASSTQPLFAVPRPQAASPVSFAPSDCELSSVVSLPAAIHTRGSVPAPVPLVFGTAIPTR